MVGSFIAGLELSELFFAEIVRPLLTEALGRQPYSSALMGYGSEVQGFDTERSTDHAWGPRLTVFLDSDAFGRQAAELDRWLDNKLPDMFGGHPVRFAFPDGTPRRHWVHTVDVTAFFREQLGADPGQDMSVSTWLTVPTQVLPRADRRQRVPRRSWSAAPVSTSAAVVPGRGVALRPGVPVDAALSRGAVRGALRGSGR